MIAFNLAVELNVSLLLNPIGLMMKFGNILLTCSFFAQVVIAAPMRGTGDNNPEKGEYGSLNQKQQETIKRRNNDAKEGPEQPPRSGQMSTAADLTMRRRQEDFSISSSKEFINQKIEEAQDVEQKWKAQLEEEIGLLSQEDVIQILQEVTADMEYYSHQNEKIASFFEQSREEGSELTNEKLHLALHQAGSEVIQQTKKAAEFYFDLSNPEQRKTRILDANSVEADNLGTGVDLHQPQTTNDLKTKITNIPSLEKVLRTESRREVVTTWVANAEIGYDKNAQQYFSCRVTPPSVLETLHLFIARNQEEREQYREAIEMVARELGTVRAQRFKNHWSVFARSMLGEPLTPQLIKRVERDLLFQDRVSTRNTSNSQSAHFTFNDFLGHIADGWASFQRRNSGTHWLYQEIPEESEDI